MSFMKFILHLADELKADTECLTYNLSQEQPRLLLIYSSVLELASPSSLELTAIFSGILRTC